MPRYWRVEAEQRWTLRASALTRTAYQIPLRIASMGIHLRLPAAALRLYHLARLTKSLWQDMAFMLVSVMEL